MFHYYDFYSQHSHFVFVICCTSYNTSLLQSYYDPEMSQGDHHSIFEGFDVKIER